MAPAKQRTEIRSRTPSARRRYRGIALLFTLGMMSLILILAMSFSFQARTEFMAARNSSDLVRARLLCESGLERALAYIDWNYPGRD